MGQPYGYPPAPPAPPAKKPLYKRTWFIVLAALVAIGVIGSAMDGGSDTTTGASADSDAGVAADAPAGAPADAPAEDAGGDTATTVGIGQDAADGKFNFVVKGVDCGQTEIGTEYFGTTAQGKFCIVDVAVTNIGDEPQSFFGENAKLFNAQGQEFSADNEASMYLEDADSLYEEINPGNTVNSKVVFDVPADMKPASIELHDSAFSGGVTVNLK
jgi:hypothetical protein